MKQKRKIFFTEENIPWMSALQACSLMLIYALLYVSAVKIGGKTRRQVAKCTQRKILNFFHLHFGDTSLKAVISTLKKSSSKDLCRDPQ